jgi:hypothetical protein
MDDEDIIRTDIEFAVADACWRHEVARHLGTSVAEDALTPSEMKGEPESALRLAYEERLRALQARRSARGLA